MPKEMTVLTLLKLPPSPLVIWSIKGHSTFICEKNVIKILFHVFLCPLKPSHLVDILHKGSNLYFSTFSKLLQDTTPCYFGHIRNSSAHKYVFVCLKGFATELYFNQIDNWTWQRRFLLRFSLFWSSPAEILVDRKLFYCAVIATDWSYQGGLLFM